MIVDPDDLRDDPRCPGSGDTALLVEGENVTTATCPTCDRKFTLEDGRIPEHTSRRLDPSA